VWTVPSRKKWKKQQINTHASRISAKLGHATEMNEMEFHDGKNEENEIHYG
jgi:hypothetical protein